MRSNLPAIACTAACLALSTPSSAQVRADHPLAASTQMLVVTTPDWNAVDGAMQRYRRETAGGRWKAVGKPIPIVVGKTGLAWGRGIAPSDSEGVRSSGDPEKKEGDGKSPAGVFRLGTAFGYAPQPLAGSKMPYLALTPSIECVDDPASKFYNRLVDRAQVAPDWASSEHMRDSGVYYRWGVEIEHNSLPDAPGAGSCIFLHVWGGAEHKPGEGTVGCTAMDQAELEPVLVWLDPDRQPLLVQLPVAEYARLRKRWQLPRPPKLAAKKTVRP